MTPSEFKAWFEGFTEDMDERPSAKQWQRIKARVKQIDNLPHVHYPFYQLMAFATPSGTATQFVGYNTVGANTVGTWMPDDCKEAAAQGEPTAQVGMFALGQHDAKELDFAS